MAPGPRAFKGPDLPGCLFRAEDLFFFFACRFFPQGRMQDLPNGGGGGGGGADPSIGPQAYSKHLQT